MDYLLPMKQEVNGNWLEKKRNRMPEKYHLVLLLFSSPQRRSQISFFFSGFHFLILFFGLLLSAIYETNISLHWARKGQCNNVARTSLWNNLHYVTYHSRKSLENNRNAKCTLQTRPLCKPRVSLIPLYLEKYMFRL